MSIYLYQTGKPKGAWETIVIYSHPAQFSGKFRPALRERAWRIVDEAGTVFDSWVPARPARQAIETSRKGSWAAGMEDYRAGRLPATAVVPKGRDFLSLGQLIAFEMRFGSKPRRVHA